MFNVEDFHWWFVARRMFVTSILRGALGRDAAKQHPSPRFRIVDIGAGTGGMVAFLEQYGTVVGIEPHPRGRLLAQKRGIQLVRGTAEKTGLRSQSMDMVCFFDVLYHKRVHDLVALRKAHRILRSGGLLVITDCAIPALSGRHDKAVMARQRYVLSEMEEKVKSAGFAIERRTYTFFTLFPLFVVKRMMDRFFGNRKVKGSELRREPSLLNAIFRWICGVEASFLPYVSYPWGSSILVLARKVSKNTRNGSHRVL